MKRLWIVEVETTVELCVYAESSADARAIAVANAGDELNNVSPEWVSMTPQAIASREDLPDHFVDTLPYVARKEPEPPECQDCFT